MIKKANKNAGSDLSDPKIESDYDSNDNETNEEEEEMDWESAEDESQSMQLENKRKKVTDDSTETAPKKKKKLDSNLYKPPTVEELNQLRETENLFHSNLFRLQIEEMLSEVRIKDKYKRLFDGWFEKLQKTIKSIEETEECQFTDCKLKETLDVCIPMPNVPEETKGTFKFLKPSSISTIGSYAFDATIGPNVTIDIMVEMSDEMFQKHDYQNYRYLRKKAIYLAFIASSITSDIAESKKYVGDNLRPILKIVPNGKLGKKVNVLIHVSAHENNFKLNRFLPDKNSIRPGWFFNQKNAGNENLSATPHHNSIILRDLTMSRINAENLKIKEYPNLRDGIILLKIWLSQREMLNGHDSFSGHIITMYILYLLSMKKLNTFMSSYQIVRNAWNNLAQMNWCENGITMNQDEDSKNRILEYQKYYDCVFLDTTGYHNITAFISKSTFSWVQREAELCLKHLDSGYADSFQSLFMKKVPFYRAFDNLICFKETKIMKGKVKAKSRNVDKLDYGPDSRSLAIKLIDNILGRGLTNRVHRICILPYKPIEWECTENNPDYMGQISVGLELNPDFCFGIVDKGPEANLPEAEKFRKFWGQKSELRRFQDGSIREAVVWSKGKSLSAKRLICKRIVTFLLAKKLGLRNQFVYIANEIEELLQLNKVQITHFVYGTGEEATLQVMKAFDSLERELMSLTDVPLSIHGVQGSSPVFRYTDVFPPLATSYRPDKQTINVEKNCFTLCPNISVPPKYVSPLEVSLQLSTSGKWPDELEAIRKTKAAFHIQIAECLRQQYNLTTNGSYSHIDVLKNGFVFRLRVAHQKEIAYLKQEVHEDGIIKYRDNEESIELETKLFELPKLSSALHGLHSQQPSFGSTCCLMKRWLSAHLLDDSHIPDIAVELLVASMYLMPAPYKPPQTPQVAFLRLLEIFARGHWSTDPIIVNLNNEMSREEIVAVETLFGSSRNTLPPLFIATPYDQQKSLWTRKAPSLMILNRIASLAKESIRLFEEQIFKEAILDFKPLFRPPLSEYDCIIHLKSHVMPRRLQAVDVDENEPILEWHPYKYHSKQKIPVVDFDPVQCFLRDLRDGYDEYALFFYDTYGGSVIGMLLKPSALETKEFKVSSVNCRKHESDGQLVLNISTMIQDFYVLGKGLVDSIDIQSKRFSLT